MDSTLADIITTPFCIEIKFVRESKTENLPLGKPSVYESISSSYGLYLLYSVVSSFSSIVCAAAISAESTARIILIAFFLDKKPPHFLFISTFRIYG